MEPALVIDSDDPHDGPRSRAEARRTLSVEASACSTSTDGARARHALAWWFLAIGLVVGLGFAAVIPPGGGADEPNQFLRVLQLAHGQVTPTVAPDGEVLGSFPACDRSYLIRTQAHPVPFPRQVFWEAPAGCGRARPVTVSMGNTAINSPFTYPAPAAAVFLASHVGLGVAGQFLAARLASLAAFLAVVFMALRLAPTRWQPLLFLVACLPASLELASTVSSDAMPIALSILVVALVLRLRVDPTAPAWWTAALGATVVVLSVSKNTYGPLALLVFLVPAERFGVPGARRWARRLAAPVLAVLVMGWWASQTDRIRHVMAPFGSFTHVDLRAQAHWVTHHPLGFLAAVERGIFSRETWGTVVPGAVDHYGTGHHRNLLGGIPTPTGAGLVALASALLAVVVVGCLVHGGSGSKVDMPGSARAAVATTRTRRGIELAVVGATVLATTLLVEAGVYASVNPIGASRTHMVQGRYFIESLPLMALALAVWRDDRPGQARWPAVVAAVGSVVLLVLALVATNQFFYTWRLVKPT